MIYNCRDSLFESLLENISFFNETDRFYGLENELEDDMATSILKDYSRSKFQISRIYKFESKTDTIWLSFFPRKYKYLDFEELNQLVIQGEEYGSYLLTTEWYYFDGTITKYIHRTDESFDIYPSNDSINVV